MTLEHLNRWLTPIANLALLAGLVLVAYELSQNRALARTQIISEGNLAQNQTYTALMGELPSEVIAKAIECPEEMTYADFMAMDSFLFTSISMVYRAYDLAQEEIFAEEEWRGAVETYTGWFLDNPFGRAWWDEQARRFVPEEFAAHVDAQISSGQGGGSYDYWLNVRARLLGPDAAAVGSSACRTDPDAPSRG